MTNGLKTLSQVEEEIKDQTLKLQDLEATIAPLHDKEWEIRCEIQRLYNQRTRLQQLEVGSQQG